MFYGLGSRAPRSRSQRTSYNSSEFIPISAYANAVAAVGQSVRVTGLIVVDNTRPLAVAVVRKEGDPWTWLPRKVVLVDKDGAFVLPRRIAEQKGLLPAAPSGDTAR